MPRAAKTATEETAAKKTAAKNEEPIMDPVKEQTAEEPAESLDTESEIPEEGSEPVQEEYKEPKPEDYVEEDEAYQELAESQAEADEDDEFEEENLQAEMENILQQTFNKLYEKRRTQMLSKRDRQKAYRTKDVVRDSLTETSAMTENQKVREEINELVAATGSIPKKILFGQIDGITSVGEDTAKILMATLTVSGSSGHVQIRIPARHLFTDENWEIQYADPQEGLRHLQAELQGRMDAIVPFVVYNVDEEKRIAYASRIEALSIMAKRNYIDNKPGGSEPRVVVGKLAPARVVGVRRDRIRVEVMGAETTMSNRDLSWSALGRLNDEFHVGDEFYVKIKEIEPFKFKTLDGNHTYTLIKLTCSKREAEKNPVLQWYDSFNVGDIVRGTVKTEPGTSNRIFVSLKDKMDAQCFLPVDGIPHYNQKCIVRITNKDDEKKHIQGTIIKLL